MRLNSVGGVIRRVLTGVQACANSQSDIFEPFVSSLSSFIFLFDFPVFFRISLNIFNKN
jgi:hypothetical protein